MLIIIVEYYIGSAKISQINHLIYLKLYHGLKFFRNAEFFNQSIQKFFHGGHLTMVMD